MPWAAAQSAQLRCVRHRGRPGDEQPPEAAAEGRRTPPPCAALFPPGVLPAAGPWRRGRASVCSVPDHPLTRAGQGRVRLCHGCAPGAQGRLGRDGAQQPFGERTDGCMSERTNERWADERTSLPWARHCVGLRMASHLMLRMGVHRKWEQGRRRDPEG